MNDESNKETKFREFLRNVAIDILTLFVFTMIIGICGWIVSLVF